MLSDLKYSYTIYQGHLSILVKLTKIANMNQF
jgi:hypothetical protein